jgi:hypothetical protein
VVVVGQDLSAPTADAGIDQTLTCSVTSVTLGSASVAGTTYAWSPSLGLSDASIAQPIASAAGTYTLTATSTATGCSTTDVVVVGQDLSAPTADAGADQTLTCSVTSVTLGSASVAGTTYAGVRL